MVSLYGAGDGNRTRVSGLGSVRSAIELRLHEDCRKNAAVIRRTLNCSECSFIAGHSDIIHATPEKVNSPGQTK